MLTNKLSKKKNLKKWNNHGHYQFYQLFSLEAQQYSRFQEAQLARKGTASLNMKYLITIEFSLETNFSNYVFMINLPI